MNEQPLDTSTEFKSGERVYCPTYGYYGTILKMGEQTAEIVLEMSARIGGSVQIKHGSYEKPRYMPAQNWDWYEKLHNHYEAYCKACWETGRLALSYSDWTAEHAFARLEAQQELGA